MSKVDKIVVAVLILLTVAAIALAVTAKPVKAPEHGSYLKCDIRGVKGACVKWSTVNY